MFGDACHTMLCIMSEYFKLVQPFAIASTSIICFRFCLSGRVVQGHDAAEPAADALQGARAGHDQEDGEDGQEAGAERLQGGGGLPCSRLQRAGYEAAGYGGERPYQPGPDAQAGCRHPADPMVDLDNDAPRDARRQSAPKCRTIPVVHGCRRS